METKENNNVLYAYLKGNRYIKYFVMFGGNEDLKNFSREFDTLDELVEFVTRFSDYNSIPVQFYY